MSQAESEASFMRAVLRRPVPDVVGGDLGVAFGFRLRKARAVSLPCSLTPSVVGRHMGMSSRSSSASEAGIGVETSLLENDGGTGLTGRGVGVERRSPRGMGEVRLETA